jgi:hypothetical protein
MDSMSNLEPRVDAPPVLDEPVIKAADAAKVEQATVIDRADRIIRGHRADAVAQERFGRGFESALILGGSLVWMVVRNPEYIPIPTPWSWIIAGVVGVVAGFKLGGRGTFFLFGAGVMYALQATLGPF